MDLPSVHGPLSSPRRHRSRRRANWPPDSIGSDDTPAWNAWTFTRNSPARRRSPAAAGFTHAVDLTAGERLALRRIRPFAGSARYQALASRRRGDQARRPRARPDRDLLRPPSAHPEAARDSRTAEEVFRAALEKDPRAWPRLPLSRVFRANPGRRRRLPHRPRDLDLQVQRVSTRVLAGAAEPCAHLARDGVGVCANGFRTFDFGLTHFPNRGLARFQAPVGGTRRRFSTARSSPTQPSRAVRPTACQSERSEPSSGTDRSGCAGASGSSLQACRLSEPPHRSASAHRQSSSARPCGTATPAGARRSDSLSPAALSGAQPNVRSDRVVAHATAFQDRAGFALR